MGLEVVVEDENGKQISSLQDARNVLHRILPNREDLRFQLLNRIDWYGDTTFNRYQVPDLRRELKRLASSDRSVEELDLIMRLDLLAARAQTEPHLYLKFFGD